MNKFRITQEMKDLAIKMYRRGGSTIEEISNISGISKPYLTLMFREQFEKGLLTPRRSDSALQHRKPKGMGKPKYVKKGYNYWQRKFSPEDLEKIAEEYYCTNITSTEIKKKYNLHPEQMQRMRRLWAWKYPKKQVGRKSSKPNE